MRGPNRRNIRRITVEDLGVRAVRAADGGGAREEPLCGRALGRRAVERDVDVGRGLLAPQRHGRVDGVVVAERRRGVALVAVVVGAGCPPCAAEPPPPPPLAADSRPRA